MASSYLSPGVYVEEVPSVMQSIAGVGTNTVGFIGVIGNADGSDVSYPVFLPDDEYQEQLKKKQSEFFAEADGKDQAAVAQQLEAAKAEQATAKNALDASDAHTRAGGDLAAAVETAKAAVSAAAAGTPELTAAKSAERQATKALTAEQDKRPALETALADATGKVAQLQTNLDAFASLGSPEDRAVASRRAARDRARATVRRCVNETFSVKVPVGQSKLCNNFTEYQDRFGPWSSYSDADVIKGDNGGIALNGHQILSHAVYDFFNNGGRRCFVARVRGDSDGAPLVGDVEDALETMESIEEISLVAVPGFSGMPAISDALVAHCEKTKYRFAILDAGDATGDDGKPDLELLTYDTDKSVLPRRTKHAAVYFPMIQVIDPALQMQQANLDSLSSREKGLVYEPVSGAIAGIYARTDTQRGVFKAPANTTVLGALNVRSYISRAAQDGLNPQGVNCIRTLNGDITVWGARTCGGDENGEWRYVNVRRTYLYIAKSIDEGTQWAVFEPNDARLWGKVRRNVGAFLTSAWRDGALFGSAPEEAFYVKCDAENNPPDSRELGRLIIEVGVSIVRPAEFVIIRIAQGTAAAQA